MTESSPLRNLANTISCRDMRNPHLICQLFQPSRCCQASNINTDHHAFSTVSPSSPPAAMTTLKRKRSASLSSESSESTADSSDSSSEDTNELNDDSSSEEESDSESKPDYDIPVDFYAREDWHAMHPMPTPRSGDEWDSGQIPFKLTGDWEVWNVEPGAFKGCLVGDCSADEEEKEVSVEEDEDEDVVIESVMAEVCAKNEGNDDGAAAKAKVKEDEGMAGLFKREPASKMENTRERTIARSKDKKEAHRRILEKAVETELQIAVASPKLKSLVNDPNTRYRGVGNLITTGRDVRSIEEKKVFVDPINPRIIRRIMYKVRWEGREARTWENAVELRKNGGEGLRRMIDLFEDPSLREKWAVEMAVERARLLPPLPMPLRRTPRPNSDFEVRALWGKREDPNPVSKGTAKDQYLVEWEGYEKKEEWTWEFGAELARKSLYRTFIADFNKGGNAQRERLKQEAERKARLVVYKAASEWKKKQIWEEDRWNHFQDYRPEVARHIMVKIVGKQMIANRNKKKRLVPHLDSFRRFQELPIQVQEIIWDYAIFGVEREQKSDLYIFPGQDIHLDKRVRLDNQILNHRLSHWHDLYLRPPGRGYRRVESRDENTGETKFVFLYHGEGLSGLMGASRLSRIAALRKWYQEVDIFAKGSCLTTKWQSINRQLPLIHSVLDRAIGRPPGEYLNQLLEQLNTKDKCTIIFAEGDKERVGEIMERICRKLDDESEDYVDKRAAELVIRKWMKETKESLPRIVRDVMGIAAGAVPCLDWQHFLGDDVEMEKRTEKF